MPLYLISTPIGNLEDVTFRAIRILKEVEAILAEDTRRTKKLLQAYKIDKEVKPYHDHNKERVTPKVIEALQQDIPIALVSDAGTPGISDPGFYLTRECIQSHIPIIPIPGPTALIAGLTTSGLPTDQFWFHGFFPKKEKKAKDVLEKVSSNTITHIFYESPHRIEKTLQLLEKELPGSQVVVARELTKKFEEFIRGTPKEVLNQKKTWKGELVLLIYP